MINPIGHFRIHRELYHKPIWKQSSPEHKAVLMTLLAMAWFKPNEWEWNGQKFKTEPGQFVTSLQSIVDDCGKGISIQNARSALKRFEKLEFLTNESTKQGRLITILNWGLYQYSEENQQSNQQSPNKEVTKTQQRSNKEVTTKEEGKKEKNERIDDIIYIVEYLNSVTGFHYKPSSKKTQTCITSRFKEGFSIDDFTSVIDKKVSEWIDTEYEKYLRPETLFGNKFESYLNQPEHTQKEQPKKQNSFNNFKQHDHGKNLNQVFGPGGKPFKKR